MLKPSIPARNTNALAFCADDNVLPYALFAAYHAATLNPDRNFDILICSLSPITLPDPFLEAGIIPVHLDIGDHMMAQGLTVRRLTITSFLRLWLPEAFADTYARIFYVDTDTDIVDTNLSDFAQLDLGDHAIGGVRDIAQWTDIDRPVHEFDIRDIGGGAYLNAGVLLINTEEFNRRDFLARMLETNRTMAPFIHNDQSLINLTLRHEWAELHPNWNWQGLRLLRRFTEQATPRVMHYVGPRKPYDPKQAARYYPRALVADYARFMETYFPERPAIALGRDWALIRAIRERRHTQIGRETLDTLAPLVNRFQNDLEVLT